ncbi:MAG: OmpA family protein [Elusimicrobia bacterium]|nr:OmpA family protein [Elusimicrobiota bacterium]
MRLFSLLLCFWSFWPVPSFAEEAGARVLFSPNGDGIKDLAIFRLSISEPENIARWGFQIRNSEGRLIKDFEGTGKPPEILQWDGKDNTNRLIPDGDYTYTFSAATLAGNPLSLPPQSLICDRKLPRVEILADPTIFSPNGDGVKDEVRFHISVEDASGIHSWLLKITNGADQTVRAFGKEGNPPSEITWDGRTQLGEEAESLEYSFVLVARDLAGNTHSSSPQSIRLDREIPLTDVNVQPKIFSPNADGVQDSATFKIEFSSQKPLESWKLIVADSKGRTVRSFEGMGDPPSQIHWNGESISGNIAPDGEYSFFFRSRDQAGNTGTSLPKTLHLDTKAPETEIKLAPDLLSPNADGIGDSGIFSIRFRDPSPIRSYLLEIKNDVGVTVKSFSGKTPPAEQIQWNVGDDSGKTVHDGVYTYQFQIEDVAGNTFRIAPSALKVDTTPPRIALSALPLLISPNGDGVNDETLFQIQMQDASEIARWEISIRPESATEPVYTFSGIGTPLPTHLWNGLSQTKKPLPDGIYLFRATAVDSAQNAASSPVQKLTLGATPPHLEIGTDPPIFSPNADGFKDETGFQIRVRSFNPIQEWELQIQDPEKLPLRNFHANGEPPKKIIWRGEDDSKRPLPDRVYEYSLTVKDAAGNRSQSQKQTIQIDTSPPLLFLSIAPENFSPNKDGKVDSTVFTLGYRDASPGASWEVVLHDEGKKQVRRWEGQGEPPASIRWEGLSDKKDPVADGLYTLRFWAQDVVGNRTLAPDQIVKLDITPPETKLSANPELFSPKGEGSLGYTHLGLWYRDASDISHWKVEIQNAKRELVRTLEGGGKPPDSLRWDGKDEKSNILPDGKYLLTLHAEDTIGNRGASPAAQVSLDTSKPVVAISPKEESIPSLAPPPLAASASQDRIVISLAAEVLFDVGKADVKTEAASMIQGAAHIIRKYPGRRIKIEGHTDDRPIHTREFPSNQELSLARAGAVRDHLVEKAGIPKGRFAVFGYGAAQPIADNATQEGRQKNRRVEIIIEK